MFRPLRRIKNEISEEAARQLLIQEKRAVLAVNGEDGYPYAFPIDFYYDPENGKIYFHGARSGHKVDALKKDDRVCFTVYGHETRREGDWAPYVQSAVVFGRCHILPDSDFAVNQVRKLGHKYCPYPDEIEREIDKDRKIVQFYEIEIEHITGKQVHEK